MGEARDRQAWGRSWIGLIDGEGRRGDLDLHWESLAAAYRSGAGRGGTIRGQGILSTQLERFLAPLPIEYLICCHCTMGAYMAGSYANLVVVEDEALRNEVSVAA